MRKFDKQLKTHNEANILLLNLKLRKEERKNPNFARKSVKIQETKENEVEFEDKLNLLEAEDQRIYKKYKRSKEKE